MIRSTKMAMATMPDRMIIAAASPLASLTAFVSKTSPPVSLSLSTRRWLNTPMINTNVRTMWAANSHVSAVVMPPMTNSTTAIIPSALRLMRLF